MRMTFTLLTARVPPKVKAGSSPSTPKPSGTHTRLSSMDLISEAVEESPIHEYLLWPGCFAIDCGQPALGDFLWGDDGDEEVCGVRISSGGADDVLKLRAIHGLGTGGCKFASSGVS